MNKKQKNIKCEWEDLEKELFTPEEIAIAEMRVRITQGIYEARKQKELSQQHLERKTGIKYQSISRIERGVINPQINTIAKILYPLGKTLDIVDLKQ